MKLLISVLGETDYKQALDIQESLLKLRQQGEIEDIMLLLEHPPTLTLGLRDNRFNIIASEEILKNQGVTIHKVNRGGDVTYHGPGQIVGYPILDLNSHGKHIKNYVRKIEETFIQLLNYEYGIKADRNPKYPGVWVGEDKITAVGTSVKRWVTMHGFAFNVNTQLDHYTWINPCGITDKGVTSLQKILGNPQDIEKVNKQVLRYFCKVFNLQPEIIDTKQLYELIGRD